MSQFQNTAEPILKKILIRNNENQQLSTLRDWLLPMLMNGQVKVKETEQELQMAAEPRVGYGK